MFVMFLIKSLRYIISFVTIRDTIYVLGRYPFREASKNSNGEFRMPLNVFYGSTLCNPKRTGPLSQPAWSATFPFFG